MNAVYRLIGAAPLFERTYLLLKEGKALVVDPGIAAERVTVACRSLEVEPLAVLLTHGHADHILGAYDLQQQQGIPVYAYKDEVDVIVGRANLALALGLSLPPLRPDVLVGDQETFTIGPFEVEAIHTPGHTKGSVCYLSDIDLFTGDTLFAGSYGRTDFPTGDEMDLVCSICNVLFDLPPQTRVYAGHGVADAPEEGDRPILAVPDTTIGDEYYTNPILNLL